MKIFLKVDDRSSIPLAPPFEGADHAVLRDPCPKCAASPCKVQGSGMHIAEDDRGYEADGYCASCKARIGTIRAEPNTLFGLREDEAVLRGRPRVY